MADENDPAGGAMVPFPRAPPPVRLEISSQGMTTTYANFFRVAGTFEELLLDFGFHTGLVVGTTPEPAKVTHRMVMSFATAKRCWGPANGDPAPRADLRAVETDPQKRVRRPQ